MATHRSESHTYIQHYTKEGSEKVIGKPAECKAFGAVVRAAERVSARVIVSCCNSESILLVSIGVV